MAMTRSSNPPSVPSWALLREQLVGFVERRVESREVAEDIVQDIYLRLQRAEADSITNPKAWLHRAARNATIDHYRTRHLDLPLDSVEDLFERADDDGPNAATRELAACLRPLVQQLPAKYQRALTLVDLSGSTQHEAARIEGVSTSGMKSRVQRGRAKLGQLLTECCAIATDASGAISDYERPADGCSCDAEAPAAFAPG